jgi:uncharacterized protein (DUF58 family)
VLRLINDLVSHPRRDSAPFTDLTPLFEAGQRWIRGRALVIAVSDFIAVPGWERPLEGLTRKHEVIAVRLFDRRETELPDVGPILLDDAETGEQLVVDTQDATFRRRFEEAAERREADLAASFRRAGVDTVSLATDDDVLAAIVRMAARRRRVRH